MLGFAFILAVYIDFNLLYSLIFKVRMTLPGLPVVLPHLLNAFLSVIGIFSIFGAMFAWAYQTGSARLGVVDLFACEIGTLCRVIWATKTVDQLDQKFKPIEKSLMAKLRIRAFPDKSNQSSTQFTSQENYFTAFENCTRDLQILDAGLVTNITGFYTYMKSLRDILRSTTQVGAYSGSSIEDPQRNPVFLLFLMLECARHAIRDLVEFPPDQAERTMIILLSELRAFDLLLDMLEKGDPVYYYRIRLRASDYHKAILDLHAILHDKENRQKWGELLNRNQILWNELLPLYNKIVCHHSPPKEGYQNVVVEFRNYMEKKCKHKFKYILLCVPDERNDGGIDGYQGLDIAALSEAKDDDHELLQVELNRLWRQYRDKKGISYPFYLKLYSTDAFEKVHRTCKDTRRHFPWR